MRAQTRREAGQALVETALVTPVLLLFLTAVVDLGRFTVIQANVESAADAIARQVESTPDLTGSEAEAYLDSLFPSLAQGAHVTLGSAVSSSDLIEYRIFDEESGTFMRRPSNVSRNKVSVFVAYDGWWLTPGLMMVSQLASGEGGFHVECEKVATLDTTLETW